MKTLVLSNLKGRKVDAQLPKLRAAFQRSDSVHLRATADDESMRNALDAAELNADDLLVIHGGDGSAQHVITWLAEHLTTDDWPRIALLPGGSTNMSAYDVNRHRRFGPCLLALRGAVDHGHSLAEQQRTLVSVCGPFERQLGFFFGSGSIVRGIEFFHSHVASFGARHEAGAGIALVRTAVGIARRQAPFDEVMQVRFCGQGDAIPIRLLLLTGLQRLFLGMRPYWGRAPAPEQLQATMIEADARRFGRKLPRLLRGRPDAAMTPAHGYHSGCITELQLEFEGPFTVDGELFTAHGGIATVAAWPRVRMCSL